MIKRNSFLKRIKKISITNTIIYILSDILIKAIAFLTLPIFLSVMSTADYGEFSLYSSYMSIMSLFFALGISRGIVRYYVDKNDEEKYLGTAIWLDLLFGFSFSIVIIVEESLWGKMGLGFDKAVVICVASICNCLCNLLLEDLRAQMKALLYGICGIFTSVISTLGGWIIVSTANKELGYLRYLSSILPIVILAISCVVYIFMRDTIKFKLEVAKYLLSFSIPLIPYALSTTVTSEVSKWIFAKVGFSEVGVYSFAINLSSIMYIIVLSLNRSYQPILFMCLRDGKSPKTQLKKNLFIYFVLYYGFLLFLNLAIKILGTEEYMGTAYIAPIIVAGYGYFFLYSLVVNYYYYYKKNPVISLIAIISAIVITALNYVLIPLFGYLGAAMASFISYMVMFVIGRLYLYLKLRIKVFSFKEFLLLQVAIILPATIKVLFEIVKYR